jgi:hypothetical protein
MTGIDGNIAVGRPGSSNISSVPGPIPGLSMGILGIASTPVSRLRILESGRPRIADERQGTPP